MRRGASARYFFVILGAGALLALSGGGSRAAHNMGQECYICHTLSSEAVVPGTRSISPDKSTGTVDNTVPFRCDYCHTNVQQRFTNQYTGHPVQIISGTSTSVQ